MKIDCFTLSMNQGKFLNEAIDSILGQQISSNYVVYDPGSKDGSRELLLNYGPNEFSRVFVDGDLGPADGLNFGLRNLKGDIFYYLNADDRLLPGVLHYITRYFSENPECDILHGSINVINSSGLKVKVLPSMKFSLKGYALGYSVVYQQSTFIRTRVLEGVYFNIDNRISWDGELIVDLAIRGARIHSTRKVFGEFRIYGESITGSRNYKYLVKQQHKKIAIKILGRNPTFLELFFALNIRFFRAVLRRISPRIEYVK